VIEILKARWRQGHRTMRYPAGPPPQLPTRFAGRPSVDGGKCQKDCRACAESCPTNCIKTDVTSQGVSLDTGRCIFCRACEKVCPAGAIAFGREHKVAASSREALLISADATAAPPVIKATSRRLFRRSLKLRHVSAGGCNACEADTNVLSTLAWDIGRFGIQFVASPRHADGLLITGPVTQNMRLALQKTYDAVPMPKLVIAVGACAISGGLYADREETHNGAEAIVPVDLYIPGCPPHPLTILDGLLRLCGRSVGSRP
jgi:Ni,Fe-hydrogenase III small subunit/Pyruvate/2-oxoacid:ferredoxin oxidoreductase delta subunit